MEHQVDLVVARVRHLPLLGVASRRGADVLGLAWKAVAPRAILLVTHDTADPLIHGASQFTCSNNLC